MLVRPCVRALVVAKKLMWKFRLVLTMPEVVEWEEDAAVVW